MTQGLAGSIPPALQSEHLPGEQFLQLADPSCVLLMQAVHFEHLPARAPRYAVPSHPLSSQVEAAIAAKGVARLFTHQAAAVDSVMSGRHTVVSTSTASGKSLCYNIPILEALAQDPRACAIYMFPTKVRLLPVPWKLR